MNHDWSEQSPQIRKLFRPWQPGDGYDEAAVAAGEVRLGVRLPAVLRSFYLAWGKRRDLTEMKEYLLVPEEWVVHSGALIFSVENQAVCYWSMQLESLGASDPPVFIAENGPEEAWENTPELEWHRSHERVSQFLDDLTYMHAFSHGACYGARSRRGRPEPRQLEWLERSWRKAKLTQMFLSHSVEPVGWIGSLVYIRDSQALWWFQECSAVAGSAEALDEIARELGVVWEERW